MAQSCILTPHINDKPSILYKDLQKWQPNNRRFINYIYACYIQPQVQQDMDNKGYIRNSQGEHNIQDVIDYLDLNSIVIEMSGISAAELQLGAIDKQGNRVDFTDAEDALKKADDFNNNHKGLVASVVQHGNVYNIIVWEKNAETFSNDSFIKTKLDIWNTYKQAFNTLGIDITQVPDELKSIVNAYNSDLITSIYNAQVSTSPNDESYLLLLYLNQNAPQVQRLIQRFGSLKNIVAQIRDLNNPQSSLTSNDKLRIQGVLQLLSSNPTLPFLQNLKAQVQSIEKTVATQGWNATIKATLQLLDKKWSINNSIIHLIGDRITKLSEAAATAIIILQRQIRDIEKKQGMTPENKQLIQIKSRLIKEMELKRYYSGLVEFLNSASKYINSINSMLSQVPTGTSLEQAMQRAKILQEIKALKDQYYPLLSALANDSLVIDQSISQTDIANIKNMAKQLKDFFDKKDNVLNDLTNDVMIQLLTQIVGNNTTDGLSIANVVKMGVSDSSFLNYLYSIGEQSNYILSAMGYIIRTAQSKRDAILNEFSRRISRATDKLYKSGSDTSFMYEDDGHIISDIDWGAYYRARDVYSKSFLSKDSYEHKVKMEEWEEQNTVERVVDKKSGRTERVPNMKYRKAFPALTTAQQEYYDTIMQIKGEIGTLLPDYAQNQYLPPQIRRSMLDAIGNAKSAQDVLKAIGTKIGNIWKIREDDTEFTNQLLVDDETYASAYGDVNNTPLREIPIFYVKPLENQDELLKNFSTGITALASTAVNYDAMNSVAQVVEFMGDFAKNQAATSNMRRADVVQSTFISVVKDLNKYARNTNTEALIDGFINQHLYGQSLREEEQKWWAKVLRNLIRYTSFRGLATNFKGMMSNYLSGMYQIFVEVGCGEFFNLKDFLWANTKLFGSAGVSGTIMELLSNNTYHKSTLLQEMFDPMQENWDNKSHKKYYKSIFRRIMSKDCAFIGYKAGEFLIHMLPMFAILHHTKVKLNGEIISLYDAFETSPKVNGNMELKIKNGVTTLDGKTVDDDYILKIRNRIRYVNQAMHGSMNTEDKGIIHQYMLGRAIMNFRQWMVRYYSKRFRGRHFDATLQEYREGYWVTMFKTAKSTVKEGWYKDAGLLFMLDFNEFLIRAQAHWDTLTEDQKFNIKRVISEMVVFTALTGLSFTLGEPDKHKKDFWRRWWIYQTRRLLVESKAAMPSFAMPGSIITLLQSPMASINTLNSIFYVVTGLDDITKTIKTGKNKGENVYWRNIKKYTLPFYKDFEQLHNMDTDDNLFKIMDDNKLANH